MIKGLNYLRISVDSQKGGRKYMEDDFAVAYQSSSHSFTSTLKTLDYVYFGVFDGHGGKEASNYTKHHLLENIFKNNDFWSNDDDLILKAIKEGFIATHMAMIKEVKNWPKTPMGLPSTAGTTASVIFLMNHKYYTGHVGDSRIIVGRQSENENYWIPHAFTEDHTPSCPLERKRIEKAGGKILNKAGVERVVWNRPTNFHQGPICRNTHFEEIPFLAVSRSLGDLWSYNSNQDEYIVSPVPDVSVTSINYKNDKCIVLASDGLWNVMRPLEVMLHLQEVYEKTLNYNSNNNCDFYIYSHHQKKLSPAQTLVESALERWKSRNLRADNTTAIVIYLDHFAFLNQKQSNQNFSIKKEINNLSAPVFLSKSEFLYNFILDINQPLFLQSEVNFLDTSSELNKADLAQVNELNAMSFETNYSKYEFNFENSKNDGFILKPNSLKSYFLYEILDNNVQKAFKPKNENNVWSVKINDQSHSLQIRSDSNFQIISENKVSNLQNCFPKSISKLTSKCIAINQKNLSRRKKSQKNKIKSYLLNSSPPSKHLRSSKWSRAKFQSQVHLTKTFAESILTKSRLRAKHFKTC